MADVCIPFQIQAKIMKRLPVKSLIPFTSVSKLWKSFIHSSKFIRDHNVIQLQHHLLLCCIESDAFSKAKVKYVTIVDDDTFPDHKICMPTPMLDNLVAVGSSGGSFYNDNISKSGADKRRGLDWASKLIDRIIEAYECPQTLVLSAIGD
ncbi:putative F-box domain-containing protein [Tanacetum coccineum]